MANSIFLPRDLRRLFWERSNISTVLGNTNFVASTEFLIPAGLLSVNGDRLIFEAKMSYTTGAAENKNLRIQLGETAGSFVAAGGTWTGGLAVVPESTASATANVSWWVRGTVTRLSNTSCGFDFISLWEGADISQSAMYAVDTTSLTFTNALNCQCAIGNVTASNTTVLTLQEFGVYFEPYSS